MNSPAPRTDAERNAYLRAVLQMNPLHRAEEVLALRNRYCRVRRPAARAAATEADPRELRQQAVDGLQRVRELFWKERLTVLQQTLDGLPLKAFPDLRKAGQRLKILAAHRQDFPALAESPGFDPELFGRLKQILVVSPREAGPLKEAVQESFAEPGSRKRALRMLTLLERELPDVYALEQDWFDLLRSAKASRWIRRPLAQGQSSGTSPLRYLLFLIPVLVSVAVAVLNPRSSQNEKRKTPQSLPPEVRQLLAPVHSPEQNRSETMQKLLEQMRRQQEEQRQRALQFGTPINPPPRAPENP
jgi:hypothetical protein